MNKITLFCDKNKEKVLRYAKYSAQICGPSRIVDFEEIDPEKPFKLSQYLIFFIQITYNKNENLIIDYPVFVEEITIQKIKNILNNYFIYKKDLEGIKKLKEHLYIEEVKDIFFVFIKEEDNLYENLEKWEKSDFFISEINSISNLINGYIVVDPKKKEDKDIFIDYLRNIRIQTLSPKKKMDQSSLSSLILKFILEHEVCVIATGYKEFIRATTVEYIFKNFKFYIISEAGEKYANLACNPNIALTIFDSMPLSGRTKSIQVQGIATIYDSNDEKIRYILESRGLNKENIKSLGFDIFVIEIEPKSIELYDPSMKDIGYSNRQIFNPMNFFNL